MQKKDNRTSLITLTPELQKALDDFPKIVKEKERNFKKREKDIKRFEQLSRDLKKRLG